jgi:predicted nucleotidyltransferase
MTELAFQPHDLEQDLGNHELNYSEQIAASVVVAAHEMQATLPEYAGLTMFGSTVRGEAGPDSDADVM